MTSQNQQLGGSRGGDPQSMQRAAESPRAFSRYNQQESTRAEFATEVAGMIGKTYGTPCGTIHY